MWTGGAWWYMLLTPCKWVFQPSHQPRQMEARAHPLQAALSQGWLRSKITMALAHCWNSINHKRHQTEKLRSHMWHSKRWMVTQYRFPHLKSVCPLLFQLLRDGKKHNMSSLLMLTWSTQPHHCPYPARFRVQWISFYRGLGTVALASLDTQHRKAHSLEAPLQTSDELIAPVPVTGRQLQHRISSNYCPRKAKPARK